MKDSLMYTIIMILMVFNILIGVVNLWLITENTVKVDGMVNIIDD